MNDRAHQILQWYDRHHRRLPWRIDPQQHIYGAIPNPYYVWLSEIMLQQTTVEAVKPYFYKFIAQWPTITNLANASDDDVMRAWAGLGYYSRARNLKKCANIVAQNLNGVFPTSIEALKALPGIGDYTAAAIVAIAFDIPAIVVDSNIERIVTRLFAIALSFPDAKTEIYTRINMMMPQSRYGDFAQAMMDLGAIICRPKKPACTLCPINDNCLALRYSNPEFFPFKAPRKEKPIRYGAAFVAISTHNCIFLRKRAPKGLLGSMIEVPNTNWTAQTDGDTTPQEAPFLAEWLMVGKVIHVFTHFELRLSVYRADGVSETPCESGWWTHTDNLSTEALPTLMKKVITAALPHSFE